MKYNTNHCCDPKSMILKFINIMEKRSYNRKIISLGAELSLADKSYEGVIVNLSYNGVFLKFISTEAIIGFTLGTMVELWFRPPSSGEKLSLHCEVKWLHIHKASPYGLTNSMGIEIIDTPQEYRDFFVLRTLKSD